MSSPVFRRIMVGYTDAERGREALALGGALARAAEAPLDVATLADGGDLAAEAIDRGAELVVLGSTHRGPFGRVVPGATASRLLGEAPCAVAVAPPGFGAEGTDGTGWLPSDTPGAGLRVIGVGYDASRAAGEALRLAAELAMHNGAALRVYAVARHHGGQLAAETGLAPPEVLNEAGELQQALHAAVAELPAEARALPVLLRGVPALELVRATESGIDLMVLGSRPGGPLRRTLHGSVSGEVMFEARCPVLIVPAGVAAPLAPA